MLFRLFSGNKTKFQAPDYGLRTYPGAGVGNAAYMPGMQDPLFSPTGTGIIPTFIWQLTGKGDYQLKNQVIAGQVQGYATGAFAGSGLLPEPISFSPPANTYALDLSGAGG